MEIRVRGPDVVHQIPVDPLHAIPADPGQEPVDRVIGPLSGDGTDHLLDRGERVFQTVGVRDSQPDPGDVIISKPVPRPFDGLHQTIEPDLADEEGIVADDPVQIEGRPLRADHVPVPIVAHFETGFHRPDLLRPLVPVQRFGRLLVCRWCLERPVHRHSPISFSTG